ncbi:hypothetical protein R6Q57_024575 [Mikania cordata]
MSSSYPSQVLSPSPPFFFLFAAAATVFFKEMKPKRSRISWKQEGVEKTFLETCVHELTLHGREGGSKALSWKRAAEKLQLEHKFIADLNQMKNHYDYLKAKFTVWTKLKNKTGNLYDPITNMFNLSEEDWQLEIKSNKHAKALRNAPLVYPDLCIQLFEGSTSTSIDSWGPSSTLPHPFENVYEHTFNDFEDIECTQMDPLFKVLVKSHRVIPKKK